MNEKTVAVSKSDEDALSSTSEDDATSRYRINAPAIPEPKKKRGEDAAFLSWVSSQERKPRASSKEALVAYASQKTIHTPREYQVELFERAKEKNTIVVLDTGSGKTLIAALLLRHTLDLELERRSAGERAKTAFFVVEKVALCFQQHGVLSANLQHPIGKLYGDNMGGMRTKEQWESETSANMAFVCTAQILLDLFNHGFIHMDNVNLLVFDEAHHAKKSHPFARIIRDHYLRCKDDRPRILGMTASPVDAQTKDLRAAALELERNLASEIATVSDEVLMQGMLEKRQVELTEHYDRLLPPDAACTDLWKSIYSLAGGGSKLHLHLEATKEVASTLGSWCADRYWEALMTDSELLRQVARSYDGGIATKVQDADGVLDLMGKVRALIVDDTGTETNGFSPKLRALRQMLEDAFTRSNTKRCIVFVQKRYVAYLLADAFSQPQSRIATMVPGYMVGSQTASSSIANNSIRDQIVTLQRFRVGDLNCLFATQVAEEGIDVPDCDLIIRFDLCDSAIQYIQSKGRARQAKSTYISMIEHGNMAQKRRLIQATRDARALRQFCSSLPADRKVHDDDTLERELAVQKVYEVPETGARLTFASSQEVLAKFVSSLTSDAYRRAEYMVSPHPGKKFISMVAFPDFCPVPSVHGSPQRSKMLARSSAAFEACVQLIKGKYINEHLQPTFQKQLPAMRNARLAISSNKRSEYNMRCKPDRWNDTSVPAQLYGVLLTLTDPNVLGRKSRPLIILTRSKLPYVEPTVLHFGPEVKTTAKLTVLDESIAIEAHQSRILTKFTLAVFRDVFSKDYDASVEEMPYYFAPCVDTHVDWDLVEAVSKFDKEAFKDTGGDLSHRFVSDYWDGSRKFITGQVHPTLKPFDPAPDYAPKPKSLGYRRVEPTIAEYSNSLSINARRRVQWKEDQPVYEAELLSLRRNFLDEHTGEKSYGSKPCVLILEPLDISAVRTVLSQAPLTARYPLTLPQWQPSSR